MCPLLSPHCAQGLLYSHTEQALTDVDWLIARLKAELTTGSSDGVCCGQTSPCCMYMYGNLSQLCVFGGGSVR